MMLGALRHNWADALGAGPQPASPLQRDLDHQGTLATTRRPDPINQVRAYVETVTQVAFDHESVLREALLRYANHDGSRPVVSILTLTRTVLELLAVQRWVMDPSSDVDTKARVSRWYSLEASGIRDQWNAKHIGLPTGAPRDNPQLQALARDAASKGITVTKDKQGRADSGPRRADGGCSNHAAN